MRRLRAEDSGLSGNGGYTFVELLVVSTMLLVLASAIMPLTKVTMQRMREAELHRALREMRTAIDKFKDAADLGQIGATDLKAGAENYPADLEILVNGVSAANDQTGRKLKFLRRVPTDPMTLVGKTLTKVVGTLRPVNIGTFNVWIVYPRSAADPARWR